MKIYKVIYKMIYTQITYAYAPLNT